MSPHWRAIVRERGLAMNYESELLQTITMVQGAPEFTEESAATWFTVCDNGRPVACFESWRDAYRYRMALIVKRLDEEG